MGGAIGIQGVEKGIGFKPRLFGRSNHGERVDILPVPPKKECEFPEFIIENPNNPSSWYGGITRFMSGLLLTLKCVEDKMTNGIINEDPNYDPNKALLNKFKISALLGKMYDLLKLAKQMQEENKKAEKDTFELALAAK